MQQQIDAQQEQQDIKEVMSKINNKIMVMSNKGGVGKSTVAVNLARSLAAKGFKVGVLDIDIHGPSQAMLLGVEGQKIFASEDKKIIPLQVSDNLSLITIAGLIENPDSPLVWRGPLKITILKQFIKDVQWGELDYLVIDSPPGTGDEPLTIGQLIPDMTGVIIVTTPQDLALLDTKKAINFVRLLKIPLLGLIENMAGFKCPHCDKEINLFNVGGGQKVAKEMNVPVLGIIPMDKDLLQASEKGVDVNLDVFEEITDKIIVKNNK